MYKLISEYGQINSVFNPNIGVIPFDLANTDYANFKKDLADGAELQDAEGNVIDGIAYLATLED
jgi:hypothetical protein